MKPSDEVVDLLATICHIPRDRLHHDIELQSVGLDSLSLLELSLAIRKDLDVAVDDGDVAAARTVGDLVLLVARARSG